MLKTRMGCRGFLMTVPVFCILAVLWAGGAPAETQEGHRTVISDTPWVPGAGGEKVIYGTDDRIDVYQETNAARKALAGSVCALLSSYDLTAISGGGWHISTSAYEYSGYPPCAGEPFANQPTAAFCTGFLVGTNVVATAGHCYDSGDITGVRFVFGFEMTNASTPVLDVADNQVYTGVALLGHQLDSSTGLDYSVIQLDRPVTAPGAVPLPVRRTGVVPVSATVGVIGHPSGLPKKIAFGSTTHVTQNSATGYFVANLDTYGGNSGSPVFDAVTGLVEGILVRGNDDFDINGSCFVSNVLSDSTYNAEEVSKAVTFAQFIPDTTPGGLQVTLEPAEAAAAGAQWRLDGGAWQNSGATMTDVPGGLHTISFKDALGWNTPSNRQASVGGGVTAQVTGTYFLLCNSVDACDRPWSTTGDAAWFDQNIFTHDGWDAAQSGAIGNYGSTTLSTEATGPDTVSFWWRVDSEEGYDYLTFYVDGVEIAQISGAVGWTQRTQPLGAGPHVLSWTYAKDVSVVSGADAGWVDQFQAAHATPGSIVINNNRSATNTPDVTLALTWTDFADADVVRMRFSDDGAHWTAWERLALARAHTLPGADGHKTVRVQYLDRTNNRSAVFSDYILLDTTPPTGTIVINNGALTTSTTSVTLGLGWSDGTGAGVRRMRFSDDGAHWTLWEPLAATRAYTLPEGPGYRTVRVQYLDGANNYSAAFNDYIKLVAP